MPISNLSSNLHKGLVKSADLIAQNARNRTKSGYPSSREDGKGISNSIKVGKVYPFGDDSLRIDISISTLDEPSAIAFEVGSGERATIGPRTKYPILPMKGPYLAFHWVGEPKEVEENAPHLPDGRVLLRRVEHSGISPKPYMEPAMIEEQDNVVDILGDEVIMGISLDLGPDEVIIKK